MITMMMMMILMISQECVLTGPDRLVLMDPSLLLGEESRPVLRDLLRLVLTAALRRNRREGDVKVDDHGDDLNLVEDQALNRMTRLLTLNDCIGR